VKAVIQKIESSKGTEEYRVGEIFLSATPDTQTQTVANANKILEQLRAGASFAGYARQYSEASTGGRWRRPWLGQAGAAAAGARRRRSVRWVPA
jgi:peptidyl-prolyl cis-trans isomerase SurA